MPEVAVAAVTVALAIKSLPMPFGTARLDDGGSFTGGDRLAVVFEGRVHVHHEKGSPGSKPASLPA